MPWGYQGWGSVRWAGDSPGLAGVSYAPGAATITFNGSVPGVSYQFPPMRATWIGVEVLSPGVASARVTWIGVEVLRSVGGGSHRHVCIIWGQ